MWVSDCQYGLKFTTRSNILRWTRHRTNCLQKTGIAPPVSVWPTVLVITHLYGWYAAECQPRFAISAPSRIRPRMRRGYLHDNLISKLFAKWLTPLQRDDTQKSVLTWIPACDLYYIYLNPYLCVTGRWVTLKSVARCLKSTECGCKSKFHF